MRRVPLPVLIVLAVAAKALGFVLAGQSLQKMNSLLKAELPDRHR
jgi:hypothetical protein